jgi:hypothetical protein
MRPSHALPLLLAAIAGCNSPTSSHDVFRAVSAQEGVLLENRSSAFVITTVMECEFAAHVNFALGAPSVRDPAQTGAIAPHAWGRVPNADIGGYHKGATAIVYYRRFVKDPQSGYYVADSLRSQLITLR